MPDVFISYSRKDKPFVKRLVAELQKLSIDVWVDWNDIPSASDWRSEIKLGIDESPKFLLVITPEYYLSEVCNEELEYARQLEWQIIPVLRCELTDEIKAEMALALVRNKKLEKISVNNRDAVDHINYIKCCRHDRLEGDGAADRDKLEEAIPEIIKAIKLDLKYSRAHTQYRKRADQWEEHARQVGFLLHGEEIGVAEAWLKEGKEPAPSALQRAFILASRTQADQQALLRRALFRFVGAATGTALSFAVAEYWLRSDNSLGTLMMLRLVSALAFGAIFGGLLGGVIVVATELPLKLADKRQVCSVRWLISAILCGVVFMVRHALYSSAETPALLWVALPAALLTGGFALFEPLAWQGRSLCGVAGVFLALALPELLAKDHAIFQFGLGLSTLAALCIGILSFIEELPYVKRLFI